MRTLLATATMLLLGCNIAFGQAIHVEVAPSPDGGYHFLRDGLPYEVKGAGGKSHLDQLVSIGGNSIRTWNADQAKEVLDEAHAKGLTVMLGLWVQHERHGFDYDDVEAVKSQFIKFEQVVNANKDHPALLVWGIGNEVDLNYKNTNVWTAINDIAAMIHALDPHHPTTTVTAGLDSMEVHLIQTRAPEIDILSINTYGELKDVPDEIKRFGWNGPYMITEWGPDGHWEVEKTDWGAPIEQNSTSKFESYLERYTRYIGPEQNCIGSYVFLWGQKQEKTPTWYGLFTEEGKPLATVDAVEIAFKGELESPPALVINGIVVNGDTKPNYLKAGQEVGIKAEIPTLPREATVRWELLHETTSKAAGGDHEDRPPNVPNSIKNQNGSNADLKVPSKAGPYRLFVYVEHHGKISTANLPIYAETSAP